MAYKHPEDEKRWHRQRYLKYRDEILAKNKADTLAKRPQHSPEQLAAKKAVARQKFKDYQRLYYRKHRNRIREANKRHQKLPEVSLRRREQQRIRDIEAQKRHDELVKANPFYTAKQAAELLGINYWTFKILLKNGQIAATKSPGGRRYLILKTLVDDLRKELGE